MSNVIFRQPVLEWCRDLCIVSQDKANYDDAPTEGIRRVLEIVTGKEIKRGTILQTDKIGMRNLTRA